VATAQIPAQARALDVLARGEASLGELRASGVQVATLRRLAGRGYAQVLRDAGDASTTYGLTPQGAAYAAPTAPEDVLPDMAYLHRLNPGEFVQVVHVGLGRVAFRSIHPNGLPRRGARVQFLPLHTAFVLLYVPYRPCRWTWSECRAQAATVVAHSDLGLIEVCTEHVREHDEWARLPERERWVRPEPYPDCCCPDSHRLNGITDDIPECPRHGTPIQRGCDMPAAFLLDVYRLTHPLVRG